MAFHDRGIVLARSPYGDTSWIYRVWCCEHGKCSFLHKGARKRGKRQSGLPYTLAEISATDRRDTSDLQTCRSIQATDVFPEIPFDPRRAAIAMFIGEFAWRELEAGPHDHEIFYLLHQTLKQLNRQFHPDLHLAFLYRVVHLMGIAPEIPMHGTARYFDPESAAFCDSPVLWTAQQSDAIRSFLTGVDITAQPMPNAQRRELLNLILEYLQYQGFYSDRLKCLDVLHEMLS